MADEFDAAVSATIQGAPPSGPQDPGSAARFGMQQALGTNPDLQAELQRVAARTGVPVSTAAAHPEEMKREAALGAIDFQGLAAAAPATARLLADVERAKISHDDVGNLTAIEQAVRAFTGGDRQRNYVSQPAKILRSAEFGALVQDIKAKNPALGFDEARALASQMATVDNQAQLIGVTARPAPTFGNIVRGLLGSEAWSKIGANIDVMTADALGLDSDRFIRDRYAAGQALQGVTPVFASRTGAGLYSGGVSLVQNAPGIVASLLTGNPAPGLAYAGLTQGAEQYGDVRERGGTGGQAALAGTLTGAIEVGTELLPMSFLVKKLGKAGAGEFIKGLLARELPGEQLATLAQDAVDTAVANPDKTWSQYVAERPGAAYETLLATLVQAGVMQGSHVALERTVTRAQADEYQAKAAEQAAQLLAHIMQTAAASKVRERDAATFETFMQSATVDGPLEKVYLNPAELQKAGIDLTQVAEVAPSLVPQFRQALETGQDVAIPTSELATRLPGSPLEQSLLPHLKTDPGGFSQAGAQEYMQGQGETVRAEVEKQLAVHQADSAFKESMKAVEDNVREQLHAANRFTEDVNGPYAAMWASFFGVQAARLGVMPQELFQKFAPRIVAQAPTGGLQQGDVHARISGEEFGAELAPVKELRTAAKAWYDANLRGTTVVNKASGRTVLFGRGNKAFHGSANPEKVRLFAALPALIENGEIRSSNAPADATREPNVKAYHWLEGTVQVGKRDVRVGVMLREDDKGNLYYNHNPINEKGPQTPEDADRPVQDRGVSTEGGDLEQSVSQPEDDINLSTMRQQARGSFNPDTNTVALLQAADLSTFLHESGHFFLEVLHDLASQPDAPQQIKDDFATFLKWTGVADAAAWDAMTLDERRAHHEDFARGFEAYLFEGKAPSVELQGLFQRFRAWLLNVYRAVSSLNVNLSPEIRGVFDRMLATTEQIQVAEDVRGYEALFKNKPEGMTADEWAVYQVQANDATQQAITELESRSLRDMKWLANAKGAELKRLQKEARARRDAIEAEVRKEVESLPVYRAIADIKEIRKSDPQDREAVKAWAAARDAEESRLGIVVKDQHLATPEGAAATGIKKGQFLARNKRAIANEVEKMMLQWEQQNPKPKVTIPDADLEAVAALHGFSSGDELRKSIDDAQPLKDVIEGMTDQRMLERHADLVDERAIERASEEAIHNDARLRFTATELNALRKATGQPALLAKAIRQFAADIIARTKVRELKPSVYTAAERRAGNDAAKAAAAGKLEDAAIQKRNQLINGHAAKAALQAQDEAADLVAYLNGFNRESVYKSLDADYIDQIHKLLERFDLRTSQSLKAIDKRTTLAAWLAAQEEAGLEPDIPPELANEANRTSYKNLTMEQLRGLADTVKQIEHLGRLKHKLLTAKDQRDYEAIRDSIVASINQHAGNKYADNRTRPTTLDAALRMFNGYLLEHRKVASLVREMDGFQDGGVLWEYVVRSMNEAGDHEATMRADAATKLAELVKPMLEGGKRGGRGEFFPSVGKSFNREERLGIALNMGNAGNIQRLLDGESWTLAQLKPVLDTLTAADWHFVQSVWDFLETYRPQVAAKERRVYGKEPNWVDPQPLKVETADGKTVQLRGGYYPIKYDTARSGRAEAHADAETAKQQMRGAYTSATTRRSFTKARSEEVKGRPLLYSTDGLFNGVNEIIHDLSWHEWLIDANRLLRSKSIDNAIRSRYGAEVARQLKSAVKDIAAGEFPATHAFERVSSQLRAGTMIAGLGLNIVNSVINVQGITQSMVRIGTKWTAVGVAKFAAGPIELSREVAAKSSMMANRSKTLNREINEIQSLVRDKSALRQAADRIMFLPLTMTQQMVDLPTWWGAYQKALDGGEVEARAVSLADQAVLDAQSGGQVKDLAGIQRGGPLLKLWTTFYGFFNSTYNLTVESTKATDFKDPLQVVGLAGNYLLLWTLPALMGTLLKNLLTGGDWDWDKLGKKVAGDQLSYLFGMLVGVRELTTAVQGATGTSDFGSNYGGPAGARFLGEVTKLATQAHQGEIDAAFLKALDNVIGILFKLPSGQVNRTVEGSKALTEGQTHNPLATVAGPPPKL